MVKEQTSKPSGRPKRKSVGARDRLLIINKDQDKEYRLVNATPDRVYQMEQLGYKVEKIANHLPPSLRADQTTPTDNAIPVGGGQNQVLMSLDKDWYKEAQQEKEDQIRAQEAAIKPKPSDGDYGKIDISQGR